MEKRIQDEADEEIEKEFDDLVNSITINQFWEWIRSWKSIEDLMDEISDWDTPVKKDAIGEIKKIRDKQKWKKKQLRK